MYQLQWEVFDGAIGTEQDGAEQCWMGIRWDLYDKLKIIRKHENNNNNKIYKIITYNNSLLLENGHNLYHNNKKKNYFCILFINLEGQTEE